MTTRCRRGESLLSGSHIAAKEPPSRPPGPCPKLPPTTLAGQPMWGLGRVGGRTKTRPTGRVRRLSSVSLGRETRLTSTFVHQHLAPDRYVASLADVIRLYHDSGGEGSSAVFSASLPYYSAVYGEAGEAGEQEGADSGADTDDEAEGDNDRLNPLAQPFPTPMHCKRRSKRCRSPVAPTLDSDKLGKLEDELSKLRAMIAAVVVKQET